MNVLNKFLLIYFTIAQSLASTYIVYLEKFSHVTLSSPSFHNLFLSLSFFFSILINVHHEDTMSRICDFLLSLLSPLASSQIIYCNWQRFCVTLRERSVREKDQEGGKKILSKKIIIII